MRILHVLPTRCYQYGGPVRVAEALCAQITQAGHHAEIFPSPSQRISPRAAYWPGLQGLHTLRSKVQTTDLVHVHGLWTVPTTAAALFARSSKLPFVITPHGMLDRWSLRHHAGRKVLYSALFERRNLRAAAALHFFNEEERDEARAYGVEAPTFLLPNGVDVREFTRLPSREELWQRYPATRNRTVLLFLGRVHPKKGLPLLVEAFAQVIAQGSHAILVIAGPDEAGHSSEIASATVRLGISDHVLQLGPVIGEAKRVLLGGADVFVLPSHQEGDSVAVKEALAAGLPVVITRACHFSEVQAAEAGLVINPEVEELAKAIGMLCRDHTLRLRMAGNARPLIERHYDWTRLGRLLIQRYEEVLVRHREQVFAPSQA